MSRGRSVKCKVGIGDCVLDSVGLQLHSTERSVECEVECEIFNVIVDSGKGGV